MRLCAPSSAEVTKAVTTSRGSCGAAIARVEAAAARDCLARRSVKRSAGHTRMHGERGAG